MLRRLQKLREFGYFLISKPFVNIYIDSTFYGSYSLDMSKDIFKKRNSEISLEKLIKARYVTYLFVVSVVPAAWKVSIVDENKNKGQTKKDLFLDILIADLENILGEKFIKNVGDYGFEDYNSEKGNKLQVEFLDRRTFRKGVRLYFHKGIYFKKYF